MFFSECVSQQNGLRLGKKLGQKMMQNDIKNVTKHASHSGKERDARNEAPFTFSFKNPKSSSNKQKRLDPVTQIYSYEKSFSNLSLLHLSCLQRKIVATFAMVFLILLSLTIIHPQDLVSPIALESIS